MKQSTAALSQLTYKTEIILLLLWMISGKVGRGALNSELWLLQANKCCIFIILS